MVGLDARMTTWQHSTPQTADASERDCLKSLHRPRNESFETQLKKLAYTRLKSGLGLVTRLPTASVINIAQKLG